MSLVTQGTDWQPLITTRNEPRTANSTHRLTLHSSFRYVHSAGVMQLCRSQALSESDVGLLANI
jgi:hypothetical protein